MSQPAIHDSIARAAPPSAAFSHLPARTHSLRTQLLFELGFLTSAAVLIVGATTAVLAEANLHDTLGPLLALWLGSTVVFLLFGAYLVQRVLVRPLHTLSDEADTLATGDLSAPAKVYETRELAHLAQRYRVMAEDLLDVQSDIVRVEKLAGIGRLAAGVAHEVRNPLGALAIYVDVLRGRGTDPEVLAEMQQAIGRIELTVQSLLTYARPGAPTAQVQIQTAICTAVDFLRAQGALRAHDVAIDIAPDLPAVKGSQHGLEQVVVNLVVNACDAAPQGRIAVGAAAQLFDVRRLGIRRDDTTEHTGLRRARTTRPRRPEIAPCTPGVLLYVADDGPGVSDADRERVFDAFYTTKEPGKGCGLGLAIVASTVHELGGLVWVDRAREGGAAFKIFLPAAGYDRCAS